MKDRFEDHFYIGTAINRNQILENDESVNALLVKEFNSITPENVMKSQNIHPEIGRYNFDLPDAYVALGQKNGMYIQGHTLIWHSQLSSFFKEIKEKEEMQAAIQEHISTIVERYKGRIDGWDVVNEALNEDGTLRESVFLQTVGPEYLVQAFKIAEKADPEAELFYNDYNMCVPAKREGAIKLIKMLQDGGAKIDGIGMQGHWHLNSPSLEEIEKSIVSYGELGLKVAITELDISVLPNPKNQNGADINQNFEAKEELDPYTEGLPEEVQEALAKRYADIFALFLKHDDIVSRVTFWGISDKDTWLNNFPVRGRTNYPLLFDRELNPKKAYSAILKL